MACGIDDNDDLSKPTNFDTALRAVQNMIDDKPGVDDEIHHVAAEALFSATMVVSCGRLYKSGVTSFSLLGTIFP